MVNVGNDERVIERRTLRLLFPVLGMGLVVSACGSSQQATSPRSACSLLSAKEASTALGGPVQPPNQCQERPGDQSNGVYSGGKPGGTMVANVSWGNEAVSTFTVSHSGDARSAAGVTAPVYRRVTVSGISAYWQISPPAVPGASTVSTFKISALKNGYVVTLTSMFLSQSQDEQALAAILSRL
jgi:hypothetical protein